MRLPPVKIDSADGPFVLAIDIGTSAVKILLFDQKGRPLTPVFTYADTRAENEVEWLRAEFCESAVHDRTG
jgi:sugar (pentulose or hexulose) kinase